MGAVERKGNLMMIGEQPKLVVDLKSQDNYIEIQGKKISYKREVTFSEDLLNGERKEVYETALKHYYRQACQVAEGLLFVEKHFSEANLTVREVK